MQHPYARERKSLALRCVASGADSGLLLRIRSWRPAGIRSGTSFRAQLGSLRPLRRACGYPRRHCAARDGSQWAEKVNNGHDGSEWLAALDGDTPTCRSKARAAAVRNGVTSPCAVSVTDDQCTATGHSTLALSVCRSAAIAEVTQRAQVTHTPTKNPPTRMVTGF